MTDTHTDGHWKSFTDQAEIAGDKLIEAVTGLVSEGNVRTLRIRTEAGPVFMEIPLTADGVAVAEKVRVEQFLRGGPLYCAKCYPTVPACDDCGWHVPMEKVADHFRKVHSGHSH